MLQLEIIGNLGRDAEIIDIKGRRYVSFSVADSFPATDVAGNRVERTTWVSVLWYGDGGRLLQYLKRGAKVFVRGRMTVKEWTDRAGEKQVSVNVSAGEVILCGSAAGQNEAEKDESAGAVHGVVEGARRLSERSDDLPY